MYDEEQEQQIKKNVSVIKSININTKNVTVKWVNSICILIMLSIYAAQVPMNFFIWLRQIGGWTISIKLNCWILHESLAFQLLLPTPVFDNMVDLDDAAPAS